MKAQNGLFITLEGIEGAGKSTAMQFLENYWQSREYPVVLTREPGGTETAEEIREIILRHHHEQVVPAAELLLYFASRAQHVEHLIKPALADRKIVICDRFTDSSYAYQSAGREIAEEYLRSLEQLVQGHLQPDITILFDLSPEVGCARARQVGEPDRLESEHIEFFKRVRANYLKRAREFPNRFRIVDAEQSIEGVEKQLTAILDEIML
jgi:dTMP kinase